MFPTFNDAAADDWQRAHDEDADTALRKLWESVIGGKGEENYVSPKLLTKETLAQLSGRIVPFLSVSCLGKAIPLLTSSPVS